MEGLGAIGELARRHKKLETRLTDLEGRNAALKTVTAERPRRLGLLGSIPIVQSVLAIVKSFSGSLL